MKHAIEQVVIFYSGTSYTHTQRIAPTMNNSSENHAQKDHQCGQIAQMHDIRLKIDIFPET